MRITSLPAQSRRKSSAPNRHIILGALLLSSALPALAAHVGLRADSVPLKITNNCGDTVWPAIQSQAGTGPSTGGYEAKSGTTKDLTVSTSWQGRVWGRTNCSFNADGTGPANANGGKACGSGDCAGVLSCVGTGETPVTLAEFKFQGGSKSKQTFYDISLVDGYNIPLGITHIPGDDKDLQQIPPNYTNAICIATTGFLTDSPSSATNASFPLPYNTKTTNSDLARWCPWDLQVNKPTKPGNGIYPYPDDSIQRPVFDPCLSACAYSNAPHDCCSGDFNDPNKCKPSLYASSAKAVCPDAYSFAYDDQTSTFIIPSGGGWEITFCPKGKSTNILRTYGPQLLAIASSGKVSPQGLADAQNVTYFQSIGGAAGRQELGSSSLGALVIVIAWLCFW